MSAPKADDKLSSPPKTKVAAKREADLNLLPGWEDYVDDFSDADPGL